MEWSLKFSPEIRKGLNCAIHMEIGVNILNPYEISQESEMISQWELKLFFERQEVARKCPDSKKIISHPFEKREKILAWYHLGTIKMLHLSFEAETGVKCSSESFRQNILFYAACPKWNDWGMCLCAHCINSEMKLEVLATFTKDTSCHWEDGNNLSNILMDLLREWRPLILAKQLCTTSGRVAAFLRNELKINYIQWYTICYQNTTVSFSCKIPISYLVITAFLAVIRLN